MLAGRAAELDALAACERPGLVLVEGPEGVGKTALIERFLAGERRVWRASGERLETSLSGGVLDQFARRGAPRDLVLDGGVLFLDDAHWADAESLAAVVFGVRRSTGGLFIVASREVIEPLTRLASVRLWLDPLPHDDLAALTGLTDGAARRLWSHTGGDLRLALDLLGEVPPETFGDFEHRLPASRDLTATVTRRLAGCDESTRALVEAAAVLRSGCRLADAATLAGVAAPSSPPPAPPVAASSSPSPAPPVAASSSPSPAP